MKLEIRPIIHLASQDGIEMRMIDHAGLFVHRAQLVWCHMPFAHLLIAHGGLAAHALLFGQHRLLDGRLSPGLTQGFRRLMTIRGKEDLGRRVPKDSVVVPKGPFQLQQILGHNQHLDTVLCHLRRPFIECPAIAKRGPFIGNDEQAMKGRPGLMALQAMHHHVANRAVDGRQPVKIARVGSHQVERQWPCPVL